MISPALTPAATVPDIALSVVVLGSCALAIAVNVGAVGIPW
jgi:hypothetical protein